MTIQPSKSDRLVERMKRYVSHDRLLITRNLSYGAAAACLVILVGLAQISIHTTALEISVYSASIALPIWLLIGGVYEYYIFLGKQSYPHMRTKLFTRFVGVNFSVAGLGTLGATGGIVWQELPKAIYAFGASALIALILIMAFQNHMAHWWFRDGGPGAKESDDNG